MKPRPKRPAVIPEDCLVPRALNPALTGGTGLPEAADALAYDPLQRLLAVATSDGRVAVYGKEAVEAISKPDVKHATHSLHFLGEKGSILRITAEGDVQLWGLDGGHVTLLDSVPCGDSVTAVACFRHEPYVLLGCESGCIQLLGFTDQRGKLVEGVGAVASTSLLPYQLLAEELEAAGQVLSLDVLTRGGNHRLLAVHAESGALVWDLRYKCVVVSMDGEQAAGNEAAAVDQGDGGGVAAAEGALREAGPETCACWLGPAGARFATGHQNGRVLVWQLPSSVQSAAHYPAPVAPAFQFSISIAPQDITAAPIAKLTFVPGHPPRRSSDDAALSHTLLALGGQPADEPDMLALISLPPANSKADVDEPHPIPWFGQLLGFAIVPPDDSSLGGTARGPALVTLSEGSQMMVFDVETMHPIPLALPFQGLSTVTVSVIRRPVRQMSEDQHSVTLNRLRLVQAALREGANPEEVTRGQAWRWSFLCSGGKPPGPTEGDLLFTGHADGRVRCWDLSASSPVLLATVPFNSGGAGQKLRAVSAIEIDLCSGILAVAHAQGELRLYQFCTGGRELAAAVLGVAPGHMRRGSEEDPVAMQPPGFQHVLRIQTPASDVIAGVALASCAGLLGIGSSAGDLSMVDLSQPAVLYRKRLCQGPLAGLTFACLPDSVLPQQHSSRPALLVSAADASIATLDAQTGTPIPAANGSQSGSPWLRPKNPDTALAVFALDAMACPVSVPSAHLPLAWAAAGATTGSRADVATCSAASTPATSPAFFDPWPVHQSQSDDSGHLSLTAPRDSAATSAGAFSSHPSSELAESWHGTEARATSTADGDSNADEDEGSMLAAALAAKASMQDDGRHKHKSKGFSLLPRSKHKDREKAEEALAAVQVKAGILAPEPKSSFDPHASDEGSPQGHYADSDTDSQASAAFSPTGSSPKVSFPAAANSAASPVAFVLLAAKQTLRVYTIENVVSANRTTLRKIQSEQEMIAVQPFVTPQNSPGVLCLSDKCFLQIFTLPRLEPLLCSSLDALLGFHFSFGDDAASAEAMQRALSVSGTGQVVLITSLMALLRVSVCSGVAPPNPPASLWDWDLATAAAAAERAASGVKQSSHQRSAQHEQQPQQPQQQQLQPVSHAEPRPSSPAPNRGSAEARQTDVNQDIAHSQKGLSGFFHQVRDTARGVIDESAKGAGHFGQLAARTFGSAKPSGPPPASLDSIFAGGSPARLDGRAAEHRTEPHRYAGDAHASPRAVDLSGDPVDEDDARAQLFGNSRPSARAQRRAPSHAGGDPRAELLQGAVQRPQRAAPPVQQPGLRSADEIRAAYRSRRAGDVANVMSENRALLAERGEKLASLGTKAEQMSDTASDFASLAKQLRDREANRKWYQL